MPLPPTAGQPMFPGVPDVGETFAGKYLVERVIGVGGMGVVVAAKHTQLGQRVAVKFLNAEAARQEEAVGRFFREARAAAAIDSEHVARVLDVGETAAGAPFMVMEYLSGLDLGALLRAHGPRPVEEAIEYLLQASEAIAQAHAVGVVHRDLKPSNLFLARRPDGSALVKVLDFGISKVTAPGLLDPQLTATTSSYGTPIYMSPEQVRSMKNVDQRTDVWALGVILHELVTGRLPFVGETLTALCAAIASDEPIRLRTHSAAAPAQLETIVLRCLEKNVSKRYATVAELATALAPLAHASSLTHVERIQRIASGAYAPPAPAAEITAPLPDPHQLTASAWGRTRSHGRGGRVLVVASATTVVIGLLALVAFSVAGSTSQPAAAAPTPSASGPASETASAQATATTAPTPPPPPSTSASAKKTKDAPPRRTLRQDDVDALKDRR